MASALAAKPTAQPHPWVDRLRRLLWVEPLWVLLLGLPLTLPGAFLPLHHTPTLVLLLFIFWPLHLLIWFGPRDASRGRLGRAFAVGLLILLAVLPISYAAAQNKRMAWLMLGHLTWGMALCVALLHWPLTRRAPLLVAGWIVGGAVIGVAALLSLVGPPLAGGPVLQSPAAAAFYAPMQRLLADWDETINANILAAGLLPAIPLLVSLGLGAWGATWQGRVFGLLRLLLCLGLAWWLLQVLTLTGSRGALLAAGLTLLGVVVLRWPRLLMPALILLALALVWLLLNNPMQQLQQFMAAGMARDYNSRAEIWQRSWRAFQNHPFTGIGIGGFVPLVIESMAPVRYTLSPQVTHAHNYLLQVGVDLGIGGLLAYLICMVSSGIAAWRAWRGGHGQHSKTHRALAGGVLAALVAINLHGLVDAPLWNSKVAFLPWLLFCLGMILGTVESAHQRQESGTR